jgi:hypothetical protein
MGLPEEALREEKAYSLWKWPPSVAQVALFRSLVHLLNRHVFFIYS